LIFCFISGSSDFGSISIQLFWIGPLPASCWYQLLAIALVLVSNQLGSVLNPMSNFSTLKTRFVLLLWVSRLLHKNHDLGLGHHLGHGFVRKNLDGVALFAGIHSLLFNRLR
jgi:hypothetical protein